MGLRRYRHRQQFYSPVLIFVCSTAGVPVSIAAGCGMISPRSLHWRSSLTPGTVSGSLAFLRLLYGLSCLRRVLRPRCHTKGYVRRKNSLQWTWRYYLPRSCFYLARQYLPIMITDLLGSKMPSTILAGVILLWERGSYPAAAVIFLASIMVPTLKHRYCPLC